jgi:hypothetical protein
MISRLLIIASIVLPLQLVCASAAIGQAKQRQGTAAQKPVVKRTPGKSGPVTVGREVDTDQLAERNGLLFEVNSQTPFSGKAVHYHPNKQKAFEGSYSSGKANGRSTQWYDNGQLAFSGNFKDGLLDGPITVWHPNGQKRQASNFERGTLNGRVTLFEEDGTIARDEVYHHGQLESQFVERFLEGTWSDIVPGGNTHLDDNPWWERWKFSSDKTCWMRAGTRGYDCKYSALDDGRVKIEFKSGGGAIGTLNAEKLVLVFDNGEKPRVLYRW